MNKVVVSDLKAGRELNARVAEAMGWKRRTGKKEYFGTFLLDWWETPNGEVFPEPLDFSHDISAAWQVVEKMREKLHYEEIPVRIEFRDGRWVCELGIDTGCEDDPGEIAESHASGETAPHAICISALKACGVKFDE